MSGIDRLSKRVASVEDADDSDNPIEGTGRYAESVAPSPFKERSNTGRTRREKPRRDSSSPQTSGLTDSDSTVHPLEKSSRHSRDSREYSPEHRRALAHTKQAIVTMAHRPAPHHANTTPHLGDYRRGDEAGYYGVTSAVTPASSRPRASPARPVSYHYGLDPSRPPPSNGGFYARHPAHPPPPLPSSYPAQSWANAGPIVYPGPAPMAPPPHDYYQARPQHLAQNLVARFGGARPQSAMGHRPSRDSITYDDHYEMEEERPVPPRRPSRRSRIDEDRRVMPPPPRPQTTRPTTLAFRPPPSTPSRKVVASRFEDDELDGSPGLFQDISPLQPYDYSPPMTIPRTRRPSVGAPSVSYDAGSYRTEIAGSRNSYLRRQSVSSGSDYEDKLRQASRYQEDIGGPPVPLTAETLRKASKHGPTSSRSTRSSGSHDESDFRQSATTQTTRSSNINDDDFTIRVKGNASLKVGGAEVRCEDGAEINISRNGPGGYRGGSDRSSYIDPEDRRIIEERRLEDRRPEDRRSRIERPAARTRTSSQSGSFSRTPSRYQTSTPGPRFERPPPPPQQQYDEYGYAIPIPPYPAYPSNPSHF